MSLFMENPAFQEPLSYVKIIIEVDPYRDGETPYWWCVKNEIICISPGG